MKASDLLEQFRFEMVDTAKPYLWSDKEAWGYMSDAYKTFVRLIGGIADFTSDLSRADIVAGEAIGEYSTKILRVMSAWRVSDGAEIAVVNPPDITFKRDTDYGLVRPMYIDSTPGPVRYMVIGGERGKCKWVQVPEVDDTAQLYIYRMPKDEIANDGSGAGFEFDEIDEEHVTNLCLWMRYRGYMKSDADAYDRGRADEFKEAFVAYCSQAKAEAERKKHKTRVVHYGGL